MIHSSIPCTDYKDCCVLKQYAVQVHICVNHDVHDRVYGCVYDNVHDCVYYVW